MDKPDFGIGKLQHINWTKARVDYVRHLAGEGLSAAEIAADIGLSPAKRDRIYFVCEKFKIPLTAVGGRPRGPRKNAIKVAVPFRHTAVLEELAIDRRTSADAVAQQLVEALFDQGKMLLENLLDDQEESASV